MTPLPTFGGADGWIASGERTYLTTDNSQHGLAYDPATGNLLVVNRSGALSINILNGATGADIGTLSLTGVFTGTSSGIFPLNMIAATETGRIYAANLADTSTAQYRIYRWESEADADARMIHRSDSRGRLGDTLDARAGDFPSVDQVLIGIAPGSGSGPTGFNDYAVYNADPGEAFGAGGTHFTGTPPNQGDHRLGITFLAGPHVAGTQGGPVRISSYSTNLGSGEGATLLASPLLTTPTERPMDFAVIEGVHVLATVDTATSIVRAYNIENPSAPELLDSLTNLVGPSNENSFGVGQVRFGAIAGDTATLYALNANNGIQAFTLTIPEPGAACALLALPAMSVCRRARRSGRRASN